MEIKGYGMYFLAIELLMRRAGHTSGLRLQVIGTTHALHMRRPCCTCADPGMLSENVSRNKLCACEQDLSIYWTEGRIFCHESRYLSLINYFIFHYLSIMSR